MTITPEERQLPLEMNPKPEREKERSCGTCAHADATPAEDGDDPCAECSAGDDLPIWTPAASEDLTPPMSEDMAVPAADRIAAEIDRLQGESRE